MRRRTLVAVDARWDRRPVRRVEAGPDAPPLGQRLAAHHPGRLAGPDERARAAGRRHPADRGERQRQVDARRGDRDGLRPVARGRLDPRPPLDVPHRVRPARVAAARTVAGREEVGLLPARRDDARLLQLPQGQPADRAGRRARLPRAQPWRVLPRAAADALQLAGASTASTSRSRGSPSPRRSRWSARSPSSPRAARRCCARPTPRCSPPSPAPTCWRWGPWGLRAAAYADLEVVGHWRAYLADPMRYLRHVL